MLGITPFGMFHTLISLVSLSAGLYALLRRCELRADTTLGRVYVLFTIASCVTGFFIVRHGGFSQAHALGIVTLVVLLASWQIQRSAGANRLRRTLAALGFTTTVFFHFIPGFNETLTRVPAGNPLLTGPEDPKLFMLVGIAFAVFAVLGVFQVQRLYR
ncbi:MAG TPA: hypothetical protein VLF18_16320 [Tahibacter sp.]|uniref:hypothetical protein n=1 Tax=Tahibacter sp. TaxID=2056211 RepID=UPI002C017A0C|nr:hypothetical protein [Tahibacter sp.]HSX61758.1 hypothetical protein [Tahibacter sp.]